MPGSTAYPAALDTFPVIGPNTPEDAAGAEHDVVHENVHAALLALQAKVGIDGSGDLESFDNRIGALEGAVTEIDAAVDAGSNVTFTRSATWSAGSAIVAANARYIDLFFPYAAQIAGVTVLTQGGAGDCVVDVLKGAFSAFPVLTSICAAAKPAISAGVKYQDLALTGWDKAIDAGSVLRFELESCSLFTDIVVTLHYVRNIKPGV